MPDDAEVGLGLLTRDANSSPGLPDPWVRPVDLGPGEGSVGARVTIAELGGLQLVATDQDLDGLTDVILGDVRSILVHRSTPSEGKGP